MVIALRFVSATVFHQLQKIHVYKTSQLEKIVNLNGCVVSTMYKIEIECHIYSCLVNIIITHKQHLKRNMIKTSK